MKKLRLLIDLDGVCARFYSRLIEWYNRDFNDNLRLEDMQSWGMDRAFPKAPEKELRKYFDVPGFWSGLDVFPGCQEVMENLHKKGHDLVIATAWPSKNDISFAEKRDWVLEHFPFLPEKNIALIKRKEVIKGDLLFDDGPHNLKDYPGLTCAMDFPFNRKIYTNYRVKTWEAFEHIIDSISEEK